MRVKYSFVCDAANISQTGNLNVLGIFSNINTRKFPCAHPKFTYVANIEFHRSESGQHDFKVTLVNDDGHNILPPLSGKIDSKQISTYSSSVNIILELQNVNFPKAGIYEIDLIIDNQLACSETIRVVDVNLTQS